MTEPKKDAITLRPQEVNTKLESYRGKAHLLTPYARTNFDNIMKGFIPVIRETYIDPDPKNKEVYVSQEGGGALALTKASLQKLSKLAGIKWVFTHRTDHREHPHIASYVAKGTMRDVDGNVIEETKSGDIDLRDGSPQAQEKTEKQLTMARRHIAALAETKAMDRVIRALLGTRSYSADELKKPFVILKLALDPNDDRVARMLQEQEAGITSALGIAPHDDADEDDLSDLTAPGTEGLNLGPVPGDKTEPPRGSGPVIDITATTVTEGPDDARKKLIEELAVLYYCRTEAGERSPEKKPLDELSDADLAAIYKFLSASPELRKPLSKEDIV